MKILFIDGYVDEPAALGVPPYLSPQARYVWGAVQDAGADGRYMTIDEVRRRSNILVREPDAGINSTEGFRKPVKYPVTDEKIDLLVLLAGAVVPGRYLRAFPISKREINALIKWFDGPVILGGAQIRQNQQEYRIVSQKRPHFHISTKDLDASVFDFLSQDSFQDRRRTEEEWDKWALLGASLTVFHPDYPEPLICDVDTSRGCVRWFTGGCRFCIEPSYGKPFFRSISSIKNEVQRLSDANVRNFRLGGQSCFFCYKALNVGETETPEPRPSMIESLLREVRTAAPDLSVLHLDNANPAVIAEHPEKAKQIMNSILKYCTPGNVLALGMESADPRIIHAENLNASPQQMWEAVKLINAAGGLRGANGMPHTLPGINILCGFNLENKNTYSLNFQFLESLLNHGLLVRRINVRQVLMPDAAKPKKKSHSRFLRFKRQIREKIDRPMLQKIIPQGCILRKVFTEIRKGKITFGRQPGSYPILVGIPYELPLNRFVDVKITGHGYRSVTGISVPMNINTAEFTALQALPGIGKKRAVRLVQKRPFHSGNQVMQALDEPEIFQRIRPFISLDSESAPNPDQRK